MNLEQISEGLEQLLPEWLPGQRWFSTSEEPPSKARVIESDLMRDSWPKLFWTLVEVDGGATYQIPVGLRKVEDVGAVLLGSPQGKIGEVDSDEGRLVAYDGLIDPVLGRVLFDVVTDGREDVKSVRGIGTEQSNTSLVYDNRLIVKYFRRLYEGANPDLEVTKALTAADFPNVAPVVATWQRESWDLAVCVPYLWDGSDGWKLALASIRDFLGADTVGASATTGSPALRIDVNDPADAGGDFGAEAKRLGEVTATLHVALAEQFGWAPFDTSGIARSLEQSLEDIDEDKRGPIVDLINQVRAIKPENAGRAVRIHGDFHLGQVLRSVSGWFIFDFEGEPARPLTERVKATSPLKDVTGMLRSFHYAAATGLFERIAAEQDGARPNANSWEQRNREAFRDGYLSVLGIEDLLPTEGDARVTLFKAFELEKAIYELAYEKAYRPEWVAIPQDALSRLLAS